MVLPVCVAFVCDAPVSDESLCIVQVGIARKLSRCSLAVAVAVAPARL